jgi:hypothetical protein
MVEYPRVGSFYTQFGEKDPERGAKRAALCGKRGGFSVVYRSYQKQCEGVWKYRAKRKETRAP